MSLLKKKVIEVWKKVKIGFGYSHESLLQDIRKMGVIMDILTTEEYFWSACFSITPSETEVEFVIKSVEDLGFTTDNIEYKTICDKALENGLGLCSQDSAPVLCTCIKKSDLKKPLLIASKSFTGPEPEYNDIIFLISLKKGHVRLDGVIACVSSFSKGDKFVFTKI